MHFIDITTNERQEKRVGDSFQRLTVMGITENRRLAASLYYFYLARRLVESGNSAYEFLAEVVLNLDKIFKVLFGEGRSDIKAELSKFGYSEKEIEEKFMPIMILRNEFDVGHVSIRIFERNQLDVLYRYLEYAEGYFRELLKRVLEKVEKGEYILQQDLDLSLKGKELKTMNRLINTIENSVLTSEAASPTKKFSLP